MNYFKRDDKELANYNEKKVPFRSITTPVNKKKTKH